MKERILRIFENAPKDLDAVAIINDVEPNLDFNFFYATGATSGLFEGCVALLWPDGRSEMFVSILEETSARSTDAELHVFKNRVEREQMLKDALKKTRRLGVSGSGLTLRQLSDLKKFTEAEVVDVWKSIETVRAVKDKAEIEHLRQACLITSEVADLIPGMLHEGLREYEAAAEINYLMQKKGASAPSFSTNASFGANAAEPHHLPGEDQLRKGQCALFDFGALCHRYGSDLTRTYYFRSVDRRQRRMYEVVLEAQRLGIECVREGAKGKDVDATARRVIESSEFKGLFNHSLGHGLGLSVHDGIKMSQESDLVLKENMVLTVEPGIYAAGEGGVRIEDVVLVTKNGCEVLTNAKKELKVI